MNTSPVDLRFLNKVEKTPTCWIWKGAKRGRGYGTIHYKGKMESAHRVSYLLYNGTIADDMHVLHKCDNVSCVNPEHLFLGTNKDNVDDKMKKGRHVVNPSSGESNGISKLTWKDVHEIRVKYEPRVYTQDALAKEYSVHQSVIARVLSLKIWKSVT